MFDSSSPFADDFRAMAEAEARAPLPQNAVLFYGSSSIRLWTTLAQDFDGMPVVNRGFGGSTLADCLQEMERLVFPVRPRAIVLYAGDNDLDKGDAPEQVLALFDRFAAAVRERLGVLPLLLVSIKPSPCRFWNCAKIRRANELLSEAAAASPGAQFIDVFHIMLDAGGQPRHELFNGDGLHMNRAGYHLWASAIWPRLAALGLTP